MCRLTSREGPEAGNRVHMHLTASGVARENHLIVIHVSASTRFKRWPEDSFVSLVVALVKQDPSRRVFLTSGPSDALAAQRIADAARHSLGHFGGALREKSPFS